MDRGVAQCFGLELSACSWDYRDFVIERYETEKRHTAKAAASVINYLANVLADALCVSHDLIEN